MDLIEKGALLEAMKKRKNYVGRLSDPVCLVEDAPTVDAVPVKHGRWIDNKDSIIGEIIERNCSLCGQRTTGLYDHFFPYCPNCGAKMDGERRESDD